MMDRGSERIGGWGAVAAGALSLVAVGAQIAVLQGAGGAAPAVGGVVLVEALSILQAAAVLAAVEGSRAALRPASRVTWAGSAFGWIGAAMLALGALASLYGALLQRPTGAGALAYFSPVPIGFWILTVAAADWRLRRLAPWLRVVGAILGALLMIIPALPELRIVAVVLGLFWWFGLGVALLKLARGSSTLAGE